MNAAEHRSDDEQCPYCGNDCAVGYGRCHCGCGAVTNRSPIDYSRTRINGPRKGDPVRFVAGHQLRRVYAERRDAKRARLAEELQHCPYCDGDCAVGLGLCHCGCGIMTNIALKAEPRTKEGWPYQFVAGHHARTRRQLSAADAATVRRRYLNDGATEVELAREYGVAQTTISALLRLETYKETGLQ